jgi:hypothetical protein
MACLPNGCQTPDRDGDGIRRIECGGTPLCGTDCDDNRTVIVPGAQTCGSQGTVLLCTHMASSR